MGRVQLVKSIIHGMLAYSFHVYVWPRKLVRMLDRWIKKIIWSGGILTSKLCMVFWKHLCLPWKAAGLDLKPSRFVNEALILQLIWKLLSEDSQWACLLLSQFSSHGRPITHYFKSSVWSGMKPMVDTVQDNSAWIVGNGERINFWTDNWLGVPLVDTLQITVEFCLSISCTGQMAIRSGQIELPAFVRDNAIVVAQVFEITIPRSSLPDQFV